MNKEKIEIVQSFIPLFNNLMLLIKYQHVFYKSI